MIIRDESFYYYNITEKEKNLKKLKSLCKFFKGKKGTILGSHYTSELHIISDGTAFYQGQDEFLLCNIAVDNSNPYARNEYRVSNQSEIKYEALLVLLSLNGNLLEDIDKVKAEVEKEYTEYEDYRRKRSPYLEFSFTEDERMNFYIEYEDFVLSFKINTKSRKVVMSLPGTEDETDTMNAWDVHDTIALANLKYGVDFMIKNKVSFVENGVICNNKYYETLEDAWRDVTGDKK